MDRKSPPDRSPSDPADMAAIVASPPSGIAKRYRPTPAKTFQCRGFGDCRMVFSRSEHLARHIRKHTGERPFGCHCGKQFSRLDNLRQHAQTVHADKQEQNEAMMRHLTSLHASMASANKVGHPRSARRSTNPVHAPPVSSTSSAGPPMTLVKQEDFAVKIHQRPGTSTGYEGDHNGLLYHPGPTWHIQQADLESSDPRSANNHSFRPPGQSFLAPNQSFLPFASPFSFGLPDRPGTGSSRPPTAGNLTDPNSRTLPPLSAIVSGSLSPPPQQQSLLPPPSAQLQQQSSQHILPLPNPFALRRPYTATRPGTAPASASFFSSKHSFLGGPGLAPARPELQLSLGRGNSGLGSELGSPFGSNSYDAEPASPIAGHDSPFFFQPASLVDPQHSAALSSAAPKPLSSSSFNPRKRAFGGPDGPYDDAGACDYGSESRPQSRRLSVLELCNDDGRPDTSTGSVLLSRSVTSCGVRPTTAPRPDTSSSALISSASALAIVDSVSPTSTSGGDSPLRTGTAASPGSSTAPSGGAGSRPHPEPGRGRSTNQEELGRSRLSSPSATSVRFDIPVSTPILHHRSGAGGPTSFSRAAAFSSAPSSSPSIGSRSPDVNVSSPSFAPRSTISSAADTAAASLSRRNHGAGDGKHDQVRITVSPHAPAAVGMRV
ncbi:hypothetical protein APHAL10511_007198 [Amanita phalloides]|nr:hypothetical protein APHAL10511_007198 [Amanita phalloides]